jgi:hypothetical protein
MRPDNPLDQVSFVCGECRWRFSAEPSRVEPAPDKPYHPWRYFATCPKCGHGEAHQASWEQALMASLAKGQSGPKTQEGIARVTQNLQNVDYVELGKRNRFNAMKHGLRSEVATCFPAKPGRYPECESCEFHMDCRADVDADRMKPLAERAIVIPCRKQLELFMLHHVAFENKDPTLLNRYHADLQAKLRALVNRMIHSILADGVAIKQPQWDRDEDGNVRLAQYIDPETGDLRYLMELNAHPLLRVLTDLVARNNLALSDLGMTPKIQEEGQLIRGHLDDDAKRGEEALEFQRRQAETLDRLQQLIENSRRDPVVIEQKPE